MNTLEHRLNNSIKTELNKFKDELKNISSDDDEIFLLKDYVDMCLSLPKLYGLEHFTSNNRALNLNVKLYILKKL